MAKKPPQPPEPPAADADGALWAEVTKTVKPLAGREAPPPAPPPGRPARPRPTAAPPPPPRRPPEPLSLDHQPGLDRAVVRRLKRGNVALEDRLDLHGLTRDEAKRALGQFLERCARAGKREVLVITGKGTRAAGGGAFTTGVLRLAVPGWLNEARLRPIITGYMPAAEKDGGGGALYVRLKRKKESPDR